MRAIKDDFLQAMSNAASSVCVVTTDGVGGKAGVTVSAMCSVSVDTPTPSLLVCVHHESPACEAIRTNRVFCANLLTAGQAAISDSFAGRTGAKGIDKFDCASWTDGVTGAPVLDGALSHFDCRLVHDMFVGSHRIFIGEVEAVGSLGCGKPLIYHHRGYGIPERLSA